MQERDFSSNKGTIKSRKNMDGKYCLQPFTNVDFHSNYGVRCCSESWMPTWIGDFSQNSIRELWNAPKIQEIRKSILDGSYKFCDFHQCPFYSNDSYYLYTREELENPELLPDVKKRHVQKHAPWIQFLLDGKTQVDKMPANYNMAYDETCNLACPSCRDTVKIYKDGPEKDLRTEIQDKLLSEFKSFGKDHSGRFNISGSGEAFISRVFTDFLFNFDGQEYPNMDVNIQSNGVLFTKANWEKMEKIHGNINEVLISLDASDPETYKKIRVNGSFEKLLANLEFLSSLRAQGKIRRLMLAFVVQKNNFREMPEAIRIAQQLKTDLIVFNLLNDWGSWTKEEYEQNAIWKHFHPQYNEFLDVLTDPIFDAPIVELGNMCQYRQEAKARTVQLVNAPEV
jgi:MoaA/NifB/PqqE/SkfB family radical SAM enzyme